MPNEEKTSELVHIDIHRLDEEWVKQPQLVYRYGLKLADAKMALAEAKANLELVEAELSYSIRKEPEKYNIGKVTEKSVAEFVLLDQDYKDAQQSYIKAKHAVDVLEVTMTALEHKKKGLENVVELHGRQYFSSPRVTGGTSEETRERLNHAKKQAIRNRK